jgi:hypothetical protein
VVLVLDVHGSHVHRSISLLARRLGIELVYVLALGGSKHLFVMAYHVLFGWILN